MALEIDHVFCFVPADCGWLGALEGAGWSLDAGIEHPGQGTRNRRLPFAGQYLELIWISTRADAESNPLRLDRRADWRSTGASPFGVGLRGEFPPNTREQFWAYEPPYAPGFTIWIHRDNEANPQRPFLFAMEASGEALERMRSRIRPPNANARIATLRQIKLEGPGGEQPLLNQLSSPSVVQTQAAHHRLSVIVGDGSALRLDDTLELIG